MSCQQPCKAGRPRLPFGPTADAPSPDDFVQVLPAQSRRLAADENGMQYMIEGAFRETERVCAIMKLISDRFEEPLHPESTVRSPTHRAIAQSP
jgi:hypothetical protein